MNIRFILSGCLMFFVQAVISQVELDNGLLFPEFTQGKAVMKDGAGIVTGFFNYNTVDEEMLFRNPDHSIVALADPDGFLIINIDGRLFEYAEGDAFYERITLNDDHVLYIRWKSNIVSEGKETAYGGSSKSSSITSLSSVKRTGGSYAQLQVKESFKARTDCSYYLKVKNRYRKIASAKALGKIFKDQAPQIENFARNEHTDFSDREDVVRIVGYAYRLAER